MRRFLLFAAVWGTCALFSAACIYAIFGVVGVPIIPHNLAQALDTFLGIVFSLLFVAFLVFLSVSFMKQIRGTR